MGIPGSRPNNRIVLVVGIICALVAGAGVLYLLRNSGGGPTEKVVVAARPLAAGVTLDASAVTTTDEPINAVPQDAIVNDPTPVIGKVLAIGISQNTVLTQGMLQQPGQGGPGSVAGTTRLDITPGYVAVTIPASFTVTPAPASATYTVVGTGANLVSSSFYIQAEDHIDVLIAVPGGPAPKIRYAFQDLRVLKAGDAGGTGAGAVSDYVVEVPRAEAELLTTMVTVTCNPGNPNNPGCVSPVIVRYVLRPHCEYGDRNYKNDVKSITGYTVDQLGSLATADKDKAEKKLHDACIYPYPNYEPLTPVTITAPSDGGTTPQNLQQLFS